MTHVLHWHQGWPGVGRAAHEQWDGDNHVCPVPGCAIQGGAGPAVGEERAHSGLAQTASGEAALGRACGQSNLPTPGNQGRAVCCVCCLHLVHCLYSPSAARTLSGMERGPKAAAELPLAPATLGHSTRFPGQLRSPRVKCGDQGALLCVPRLGLGSLLPVLGRDIGKRLEVRRKVDACLGKANYISRLEHAQARLTLSYNRRGDLAIHLVSPMGTRSTLLAARYVLGQGNPRPGLAHVGLQGTSTHLLSPLAQAP